MIMEKYTLSVWSLNLVTIHTANISYEYISPLRGSLLEANNRSYRWKGTGQLSDYQILNKGSAPYSISNNSLVVYVSSQTLLSTL
jgi:hypothetical protein